MRPNASTIDRPSVQEAEPKLAKGRARDELVGLVWIRLSPAMMPLPLCAFRQACLALSTSDPDDDVAISVASHSLCSQTQQHSAT